MIWQFGLSMKLKKLFSVLKTNSIILVVLLFSFLSLIGQENPPVSKKNKVTNKGKFFAYWGWNWASYTNSDIRFKGEDYDFTLSEVRAQDRQTKFSFSNYFKPSNDCRSKRND